MASTGTIWNPVTADWRVAQDGADRRCRSWGYAGAGSYSGWQEACRQLRPRRPLRPHPRHPLLSLQRRLSAQRISTLSSG